MHVQWRALRSGRTGLPKYASRPCRYLAARSLRPSPGAFLQAQRKVRLQYCPQEAAQRSNWHHWCHRSNIQRDIRVARATLVVALRTCARWRIFFRTAPQDAAASALFELDTGAAGAGQDAPIASPLTTHPPAGRMYHAGAGNCPADRDSHFSFKPAHDHPRDGCVAEHGIDGHRSEPLCSGTGCR